MEGRPFPSGRLVCWHSGQHDHDRKHPKTENDRQAGQVREGQQQGRKLAGQDNAGVRNRVSMALDLLEEQKAGNVDSPHDHPGEDAKEWESAEGTQQAVQHEDRDDQQGQSLAGVIGQSVVVKPEQQVVPGIAGSLQNQWVHRLRSGGGRCRVGQFLGDFQIDFAQSLSSALF